ncbi:hypothetical protein C8J56DRAFT_959461 [Mycena floridula]|nr:hypothetical protein C8J56DRAFT_959461 [Mycena floridula]
MNVEKQLFDAFPQRLKNADQLFMDDFFRDRPPISNVYSFGVVLSRSRASDDEPQFECKEHKAKDCASCFDWGKIIIAKMKKSLQRPDIIDLDLDREAQLGLLASMGIALSRASPIPDLGLQKRLFSAIDYSQKFAKFFPSANFVDPSSLSIWTNQSKPAVQAVMQATLAEMTGLARGSNTFPPYQDAFLDVRQTIAGLAKLWDQKKSVVVLQDKSSEFAICVRIVNVYVLKDGIPLIVILYGRGSRSSSPRATLDWSTPQEQELLLSILNLNADRVALDYKPSRAPSERTFSLSFLLPMTDLNQQQITTSKLQFDPGCLLCGSEATKRCTGCSVADYCSTDCQKKHWKAHKPLCTSLKGGKWQIVHGGSAFLVKIQREPSDGAMLFHDAQTSFHLYLRQDEDPAAWSFAEEQMSNGLEKIYRWAKRTVDDQLTVCFDKPPLKDPEW